MSLEMVKILVFVRDVSSVCIAKVHSKLVWVVAARQPNAIRHHRPLVRNRPFWPDKQKQARG